MDLIENYLDHRVENQPEPADQPEVVNQPRTRISDFFVQNDRAIRNMLYEEIQYVSALSLKHFWIRQFLPFGINFNLDLNLVQWSAIARDITRRRLQEQVDITVESMILKGVTEKRKRVSSDDDYFQFPDNRRARLD